MYFQRETSQGLAAGRVSLVNARAPSQMLLLLLLLLLLVGTDVIVHPLIIKSCLTVEIAAAGFHDHGQQGGSCLAEKLNAVYQNDCDDHDDHCNRMLAVIMARASGGNAGGI